MWNVLKTIIFMVIYAYDKYNIYVLDWMCTLELNSKQLAFFGGMINLKMNKWAKKNVCPFKTQLNTVPGTCPFTCWLNSFFW